MIEPEDLASRLEKAKREKAERDAQRRLLDQARELEALEFEGRYDKELGARGVAFEIVETAVGNFVVRRGDFVAYKRYLAIQKPSDEDVFALVSPYVIHPDAEGFKTVARTHGGIVWLCARAMLDMYAAQRKEESGK